MLILFPLAFLAVFFYPLATITARACALRGVRTTQSASEVAGGICEVVVRGTGGGESIAGCDREELRTLD